MNCPICLSKTKHFINRKFAPFSRSNIECENFVVEYVICENCGLIFCPEMVYNWTEDKFSELCYNDGYKRYDMDIVTPNGRRQNMSLNFIKDNIKCGSTNLDYGGGNGYLSDMLNRDGYISKCYDPFTRFNDNNLLNSKYDFVSCIEVLEHSYNIINVVSNLAKASNGIIYVSTGLYDNVRDFVRWYYFNPRVGHILLFRKDTIEFLFSKVGYHIEKISVMEKEQMNILLKENNHGNN